MAASLKDVPFSSCQLESSAALTPPVAMRLQHEKASCLNSWSDELLRLGRAVATFNLVMTHLPKQTSVNLSPSSEVNCTTRMDLRG